MQVRISENFSFGGVCLTAPGFAPQSVEQDRRTDPQLRDLVSASLFSVLTAIVLKQPLNSYPGDM